MDVIYRAGKTQLRLILFRVERVRTWQRQCQRIASYRQCFPKYPLPALQLVAAYTCTLIHAVESRWAQWRTLSLDEPQRGLPALEAGRSSCGGGSAEARSFLKMGDNADHSAAPPGSGGVGTAIEPQSF